MPTSNLADRFWTKVDRRGDDECWPWTAGRDRDGYGRIKVDGVPMLAHRVAWLLTHDDLPPVLDHVCHEPETCAGGRSCEHRACCNPAHCTASTIADNARRGVRHTNGCDRLTECRRGHPFTPENTYRHGGRRHCRRCHAGREAERRLRRS